jgi:SAM-dependent methyltransferase
VKRPADIAALFDPVAADYDRAYDETGLNSDWLRSRLEAALDLLGEGPGVVLDAGTGPGRLIEQLERRGWTGWGIDASPNMVARARERVPAASERIVEGRVEALPFPDGTFDAVVAIGVLLYSSEPEALVRELGRVLRPGGRAVISIGNGRSPFRLWRELVIYPSVRAIKRGVSFGRPPPPLRYHCYMRRASRLLRAAGLEPQASRTASHTLMPDPLDRVFPRTAARLGRFAARRGSALRTIAALHLIVAARKASSQP